MCRRFYDASDARGMSSDDLLVLEGRLDRELVLGFLASVQSRVSAGIAAISSFTTAGTAPMPQWTRSMPPRPSRRSFSARMTWTTRHDGCFGARFRRACASSRRASGSAARLLTHEPVGRQGAGGSHSAGHAGAAWDRADVSGEELRLRVGQGDAGARRDLLLTRARAMPEAQTFEDWLAGAAGLIEADAHSGRPPKRIGRRFRCLVTLPVRSSAPRTAG